jgi:hypothetical protein
MEKVSREYIRDLHKRFGVSCADLKGKPEFWEEPRFFAETAIHSEESPKKNVFLTRKAINQRTSSARVDAKNQQFVGGSKKMKTALIIPARYGSTAPARQALAMIAGKRFAERLLKSRKLPPKAIRPSRLSSRRTMSASGVTRTSLA